MYLQWKMDCVELKAYLFLAGPINKREIILCVEKDPENLHVINVDRLKKAYQVLVCLYIFLLICLLNNIHILVNVYKKPNKRRC